ncbi:MAG TPA: o-succinylbenzoate synthase [Ktedonobacterales bacterium]|nr:o-succinylbenzoate synthase [Ktedonobacterales bacterium]
MSPTDTGAPVTHWPSIGRITRAEALCVGLRMREPFVTPVGSLTQKDALLVRLTTDDGVVGYGESGALPTPSYSPEYIETAWDALTRFILPALAGQSFSTIDDVTAGWAWMRGHNFAKVAPEAACWHILAQRTGQPLRALWGGERQRIEVGAVLGIAPTSRKLLAGVEQALAQGYRRIKIKIAPGADVAPVAAIRRRFGAITLMADANSTYTLGDLSILQQLDEYSLLMIEQPLGPDDIIDHAQLQARLKTPICLDESILTLDDARQAIALGACHIINVKPPRVGGFGAALRIAEYAYEQGIGVWCGGMFETGIGKAFNAQLCAVSAFTLPADNPGTHSYYECDLLMPDDPICVDADSHITLPNAPGLGWRIDEAAIERLTTRRAVFEA